MTQERLEEAKRLYETANADQRYVLESLFPELKESEDERIRKELISYHRSMAAAMNGNRPCVHEAWIAWLERQGKQRPVNKVEPKFKVGDWITNRGHSYLIAAIEDDRYLFEIGGYTNEQLNWEYIKNADEHYHLWTIQDAKDGDVLYSPCCKLLFIFKNDKECHVGNNLNYHAESIVVNSPICVPTDSIPADKEQRDLLFQKMKEAECECDAEKMKLKKISQRMISAEAKEAMYDKPAWSEEDEEILQGIWDEILANKHEAKEYEWKTYDKFLNWLKSLKDRYTWKPSDEQMKMLKRMKAAIAGEGEIYGPLNSLYEDLKKL